MAINCPKAELNDWKKLKSIHGEARAYALWIAYDGDIPESLYKKQYDEGFNYSFMAPYMNSVMSVVGTDTSMGMYSSLTYILSNPALKQELQNFILGSEEVPGLIRQKLPKDKVVKIIDTWVKDYIAYNATLTNKVNDKELYDYVINEVIKLKEQQKDSPYRSTLIDKLNVVNDFTNQYGNKNLAIDTLDFDKIESDQVTNDWVELYKQYPDLAEGLAKFVILQSGLQNNPVTFRTFIPARIWNNLLKDGMVNIRTGQNNIEDFKIQFLINNYTNNDLVPRDFKGKNPSYLTKPITKVFKKDMIRPELRYYTSESSYVTISPAKTGNMDFYSRPAQNQVKQAYNTNEVNKMLDIIKGKAKKSNLETPVKAPSLTQEQTDILNNEYYQNIQKDIDNAPECY